MRKLLVLVLLSTAANAAFSGWADAGKVTRVHSGHGNGGSWAFTTEKHIAVEGCENRFGYFAKPNQDNTDRMYSLLLAAYIANKPVAVFTTGSCLNGRPEVNAVQFKDGTHF